LKTYTLWMAGEFTQATSLGHQLDKNALKLRYASSSPERAKLRR
jgi:hypothetical protein